MGSNPTQVFSAAATVAVFLQLAVSASAAPVHEPRVLSAAGVPGAQDATAGLQQQRPMTTDDVLDMVSVGGATISPDGEWVLYSRSDLAWDENERKTTWWKVPAEGGRPFRFIGEDGGSAFTFSPTGDRIAFRRNVDGKQQLFVMRTDGGEAVRLTDHESSVGSFAWAGEDGVRIVFIANEPRSEEEEAEHEKGADAIWVDEGPNGQGEGSWSNLWIVDAAFPDSDTTWEATRLTEQDRRIGQIAVSPDGSRVAFTARDENRRNQSNLSEIHLLRIADGEVRRLTDNRVPESRIRWSPDGERLAYTAVSDDEWELRLARIWVMDVGDGTRRSVSDAFSGNIGGFVWTPDGGSILFGAQRRTNRNLYRLDVRNGNVEQLTSVVGSLSPASFSRDRERMVYTYQDFDTPPDLWVSDTDGEGAVRLTRANPQTESFALADGETVTWTSSDGTEIEGILMLPLDAEERNGDHPLLLHIHGGPAGSFSNTFSGRNQVWAGLGYAQLSPNVRGSSGYDDELLRGNMYDIGGGDYQDLMTGVDDLVAQGIADPDRLALRGWSYGGILGGWTITQTDRFKAASVGAMVSDWTSEYGPGFNHDVRLWYIGGTPWDNPEAWRERSPLTHVANVTTPTLILHGMADRTDTEQQSMMFFQALKDQGKDVRYLRFPREPHGFREPRHQRTRDVEEIRWIQKYALGIDWTPWERPKKEKKVVS